MSRPSEHRDVPRATTADEERVGTVIDGRYRLDGVVGRGGMGVVYRGEHVGIRRTVALKLLHPTLAQVPELRSRFEREARAIGVISHPNCVDVSDFGELPDGALYLVMEYLEGISLGDLLDRERTLEPRRALRVLRHVLHGLAHAHQAGIVHRDVKPENVFLVKDGEDRDFAKILDFGIAKLVAVSVDDGVKLTQAGVAFGTPVYMSPEQALGNPVDARADLYAASVMAYEAICGRPPFYSDDKLEVLSMHTARPVPSMDDSRRAVLGAKAPPLPLGVERVILKGLVKQPRDRWQSAQDYAAAIDEVLISLQIETDGVGDAPTNGGARPLLTNTGRSVIADDRQTTTPRATALPALSEPIELVVRTAERPKTSAKPGGGGLWERIKVLARTQPAVVALAGAGMVVVLAVIILLATRGGSGKPPVKASALAQQAAQKLERGDPAAAIKILEKNKEEIAEDPSAQLVLGHAYAAKREHAPALLAYQRALELAPSLESDDKLRANLTSTSNDTDMAAAMAAYELLVTKTRTIDAETRLLAAASGKEQARRRAAGALVERLGLSSKVDWLTAYLLDLEQEESCVKRKPVVAKLRALGDARAIAPLELAIGRKGKTGKWKGKIVNNCLAAEARAAISFLADLSGARPDAGAIP